MKTETREEKIDRISNRNAQKCDPEELHNFIYIAMKLGYSLEESVTLSGVYALVKGGITQDEYDEITSRK